MVLGQDIIPMANAIGEGVCQYPSSCDDKHLVEVLQLLLMPIVFHHHKGRCEQGEDLLPSLRILTEVRRVHFLRFTVLNSHLQGCINSDLVDIQAQDEDSNTYKVICSLKFFG